VLVAAPELELKTMVLKDGSVGGEEERSCVAGKSSQFLAFHQEKVSSSRKLSAYFMCKIIQQHYSFVFVSIHYEQCFLFVY
jgi:hypothetical protein